MFLQEYLFIHVLFHLKLIYLYTSLFICNFMLVNLRYTIKLYGNVIVYRTNSYLATKYICGTRYFCSFLVQQLFSSNCNLRASMVSGHTPVSLVHFFFAACSSIYSNIYSYMYIILVYTFFLVSYATFCCMISCYSVIALHRFFFSFLVQAFVGFHRDNVSMY